MGTFDKLLGHVIDLNFNTHEAMIKAALLWQLEEYQLDRGAFKGVMKVIHTSHIQIGSTSRSSGIFIRGKSPKSTYLFASIESEGKITHNGLSVYADELIVLNDKDVIDYTVSTGVGDVTIAVDKDFFDAAYKDYFNKPFQYDKTNKRIQLKENRGFAFRASVKERLTDLMAQNIKLVNDPAFHAKAEQAVLHIIFQNIDPSGQRKKILESDLNANEVRKYIEVAHMNDIRISRLSSLKKFPESTIRRGFKNLFGFSPKQYLQSYRLGKVHHALLQNDHRSTTVEKIAFDHGFFHMGRFSDSYKSMFGKTPSLTLKESLSS